MRGPDCRVVHEATGAEGFGTGASEAIDRERVDLPRDGAATRGICR